MLFLGNGSELIRSLIFIVKCGIKVFQLAYSNSNKFFSHIENDRQLGSKQNVFAYEVIQIPWRMC